MTQAQAKAVAFRAGFVSVVGRPNAGKSTLLNALVGEKVSITARQAQTTRTSVQGILTTGEAQIVFIDTPGIHKSDTLFNKRMMQSVRDALEGRDLVLYVADAARQVSEDDQQAVSALPSEIPAILVLTKIDRLEDKRSLLALTESYLRVFPFAETVPVSARKRDGLTELTRTVVQYLPEGPALFPADHFTDQPLRFLAGEIIRERILHNVREEVPHASAILVDRWEDSPTLVRIAATIHVERPGQKVILIGTKGATLKKIGTEARQQLERMLERKVFLSLFVKVHANWREDPAFLDAVDWRSMLGS